MISRPCPAAGSRLFCFGTLQAPAVFQGVTGFLRPSEPATLSGFEVRALQGEAYPGLLPRIGGLASGLLYSGITAQDWQRLDLFEGELYQRTRVQVNTAAGAVDAWAYLMAPGQQHLTSEKDWSLQAFMAEHQPAFMAGYIGFSTVQEETEAAVGLC